jgi:hypothetical protein
MPPDTHCDSDSTSDWTVGTLKALIFTLLNEHEKRIGDKFNLYLRLLDEHNLRNEERFTSISDAVKTANTASEKAIIKAESATEKRFEGVNEFRGAMADAQQKYITKSEAIALILVICSVVTIIFQGFVYFTSKH